MSRFRRRTEGGRVLLIAGASRFKDYRYVILRAYDQAARGSAVLVS
jgi:hypothetical protein